MSEMIEFKDIANNAWTGIQEIQKTSYVDITAFAGRAKRQYGNENIVATTVAAASGGESGYGAQSAPVEQTQTASSGGCSKLIYNLSV